MIGLMRPEWQKVIRNYLVTGSLVWVYPIGVIATFGLALLVGWISEDARQGMLVVSSGQWTLDALWIWAFITSFPASIFGWMLPLSFVAVVFAGEYQAGTWKNLVPRSRRTPLMLSKFITLTLIMMVSFVITSIIVGLGQTLFHSAAGVAYGPALTSTTLASFLGDYSREALLTMSTLLILAGFASLGALISHSMLGSLLIGFGLSLLELLSHLLLRLLSGLLNAATLVNLYQFTPSYSVQNIRSWLITNSAQTQGLAGFTAQPTLVFSIIVLAAWIIGLIGSATAIFQRQDIVS